MGSLVLPPNEIIFYDGDCGFCNRSVQLILRQEKDERISFAALQSDFATSFFAKNGLTAPDFSSFYFYRNKRLYAKSSAVFQLIPYLKWYWQALRLFGVLPKVFTDACYSFIAKRRKQLGRDFCLLPDEKMRKRFLYA